MIMFLHYNHTTSNSESNHYDNAVITTSVTLEGTGKPYHPWAGTGVEPYGNAPYGLHGDVTVTPYTEEILSK